MNERFGRLVVVREIGRDNGHLLVEVRCDCGALRIVRRSSLDTGNSKSCGCLPREQHIRHGHNRVLRRSPEYMAWDAMIQRCENDKHPSYKNYGARGITVCQVWRDSYLAFIADIGPRPSPAHSIDRKDNNGNYEPGNCRWATVAEQANNRRPGGRNVLSVEQIRALRALNPRPSYNTLARQYGVSFTAIRNAIVGPRAAALVATR